MIDVTQDAIQVLLDHPRSEGMMVSCYADTAMTDEFQWLWSLHLKNEASAIEQRLKDDHQTRARFVRDLGITRHALEDPAAAWRWCCRELSPGSRQQRSPRRSAALGKR